jgi:hypothetical protein
VTASVPPKRRRGRPRTDTEPTGITRTCGSCRRELDLAEWSPSYRAKRSAPCRDCASAASMAWAARNRDKARHNQRRWRAIHDPPPPKPTCVPGHKIIRLSERRWTCATCREAHKRQRGRELWQQVKADPERLEAKRLADRESKRRRTERERALRPRKPSRQQPDGTWRCIGCGQTKAPAEFYTRTTGRPETQCKACSRARRRELWATRRASQDG